MCSEVSLFITKEPVGPGATFTPSNLPINQVYANCRRRSPPLLDHRQDAGGPRSDPLLSGCRHAERPR